MAGWISLNRSIQNHWIYEEDRTFSKYEAWLDLLFMVNHKDKKTPIGNQLIDVKRGQRITSIKKLSEHWSWSRSKVNSFLKLLESDEMITFKTTSKYTLVTIVNYDFYQSEKNRKSIKSTSNEQQININTTSSQHQSDTNNNDNNELIMKNNENNDDNQSVGVVFQHYEDLGFGLLNGHKAEQINQWIQTFNTEVVIEAMKIASNANKSTMGYLNGILNNWKEKGFKSIEEVKAESIQRRGSNKTRSYGTPNPYHHNDDLPF